MRSFVVLGLLIALGASANAAAVHLRTHQHVVVPHSQGLSAPTFAIPGWSDQATRRWLGNASAGWKQA
jgi:hypothetical protein